jgi:carnitine 3-dehydrogenase
MNDKLSVDDQGADDQIPSEDQVAVIGAGNTGASWAGLFAAFGYAVRLYDIRPGAAAAALARAAAAARFLAAKGLADPDAAERGVARLAAAATLEEAVAGVTLVQECVTDDVALKREVFAAISHAAPDDALIATSSSGLSITEIQQDARLPGRTLAAHPYNPPHIVPLVELAPGELTDAATLERAREFYLGVGKEPVLVSRDVPGYIANRMSAALWREAIELVRSGVATVEDVDKAICYGPGLRWAVMGPHLVYHLGGGKAGIRGHVSHLTGTKEGMLRDLATWTTFPADTAEMLARGLEAEVAGKTLAELEVERDEALAAVVLTLRQMRSGQQAPPRDPSVLAVVPAHNEAPRVAAVVEGLIRQGLPVLVVDDGSGDGTGEVARAAGARVLRLEPNQGKGAALKAGFRAVLAGDWEAILTLDGDGQHDPAEVPAFLEARAKTGADLIIGARDYRGMPPIRWFTNTVSRRLFSWALGKTIPDNQSGYRLLTRRLAEAALTSPEVGFAFEVDEIAICVGRGYELAWVPIKTIYGEETSDIKPWAHFVSFLRVTGRARRRAREERRSAATGSVPE